MQLIVQPLSYDGAMDPHTPIVIVLDALDECGDGLKRETLVELLSEKQIPRFIRIIITSRPERDIRGFFEFRHHILVRELDITSEANADDILSYLRGRMMRVRMKTPHLRRNSAWPDERDIRLLAERASGLFVWASTASKFIDSYDPKARLSLILKGEAGSAAENSLDTLYRTALELAGSWDDGTFIADFKTIIGIVLVARHPISNTTIDLLRGSSEGRPCIDIIEQLGCLLQQQPEVRFLHPSFADFLLTPTRSGRSIWFFDQAFHNRSFAFCCLSRLSVVLRQNVNNLIISPGMVEEKLAEDITYACLYWIDHVCIIKEDVANAAEQVWNFLRDHFLHWVEAMSIMKRSRDAITALDRLSSWISVSLSFKSSATSVDMRCFLIVPVSHRIGSLRVS